jgi:hypothetical protein
LLQIRRAARTRVNVSRLTFKPPGVRTGGEGRRLAELLRYVRVPADAQVVLGACPSPTRGECAIHDSNPGISAHAGTAKLPRTRSCGPNILAELSQSPVPRRHAAMAIAELRAPPGFPSLSRPCETHDRKCRRGPAVGSAEPDQRGKPLAAAVPSIPQWGAP